ncbi:hypothetical protein MTR67_043164, partial [Solanum verrucosum]
PVAHRLVVPPNLSGVHPVFHVSMLKRYHGDGDYIIKWVSIVLDKDLQYEEESVIILDHDVRKLRTKEIRFVKVQWKHLQVEEATWKPRRTCETSIPNCSSIQLCLSKSSNINSMIDEKVLLKVSPMKGVMRFRKNVKLRTRSISPFEVIHHISELALPLTLLVIHQVHHVLMINKYQIIVLICSFGI